MSIEAEFREMFPDVIVVEKRRTRDRHGQESFMRARRYPALVQGLEVDRRSREGENVAERPRAFVYGTPGITTQDRVTLPDGSQPTILAVARKSDENGAHHEVLTFGLVLGRG